VRVVLVSLPFRYFPHAPRLGINYVRPPLGIASLAAFLRARMEGYVQVHCLDLMAETHKDADSVADRILALRPDIVGLTVLTATANIASAVAQRIRQRSPGTRVAAGGPHVTALPAEPMPGVDAKILGEGEESLLEWIEAIRTGGSVQGIPGVCTVGDDGKVEVGVPRPFLSDLDTLPFAALDLLPMPAYYHGFPYRGVRQFATMMTSRGCPCDCNFCGNRTIWKRRMRSMSPTRVLAELDWLTGSLGVDLVFFEDDTFTADRDRSTEILQGIRANHPGLRWICHTRVDRLDEALAAEMAASGCVEVQVGVETGDPDLLAGTGKGINLERAAASVAMLKRHDINVWATFILGHELETADTIEKTIRTAIEMDPTYASFIVLLPFPGTRVFDRFQDRGLLTSTNWEDYSWHGYPVFQTDLLPSDDLVRYRSLANRRFYLRPSKLAELGWKTLRAGSTREMLRNFLAWSSLVVTRGR
jgi:radical SAM superfamily enzyme YgiQ (UPF0313 family)